MSGRQRSGLTAALIASLFAFPPRASAQEWGGKAGVNAATTSRETTTANLKRIIGPVAGVFVASDDRKALGVEGELLISAKGAKTEGGSVRLTYLEIPILIRSILAQSRGTNIHLIVGPSVAVRVGGHVPTGAVGDVYRRYDTSLTIGADADAHRLVVDVRYSWGLTNILKNGSGVKNQALTIMIGRRVR